MAKELMKGNEAVAEAAIRAGVTAYFGYPITPQTELLEYMSRRMPELGRAFVQAESELGAINMVYGAACTGQRVMSSSSSPGVSLMMEAISYIAGTELPVVLVDVMRGGPGLGNIAPGQGDYNQIVHGGGHGEYHAIVLAPASVQESVDLTVLAFELAEKYRSLVVVLSDGSIGQMMEPCELPPMPEGYFAVDHRDVPGVNRVHIVVDDMPVFAEDTVEYIGDPVLMIVGPDEAEVERRSQVAIQKINRNKQAAMVEQMAQLRSSFDTGDDADDRIFKTSF